MVRKIVISLVSLVLILSVIHLSYVSGGIEIIGEGEENIINLVSSSSQPFGDTNATTECSGINSGESVLLGNSSCNEFPTSSGGGGGGFDATNVAFLNNSQTFTELNRFTGNVSVSDYFFSKAYLTEGTGGFPFNYYDDGSEAFLNFTSIVDAVNFETDNTKLVLFNEPKLANDFKVMQIFSKEASDVTEFVVTKAGLSLASYFIRSLAIAGNSTNTPDPFNCSTFATHVDCKTDVSGADLWVQDDVEVNDHLYVNNNASITNNFTVGGYLGGSAFTGMKKVLTAPSDIDACYTRDTDGVHPLSVSDITGIDYIVYSASGYTQSCSDSSWDIEIHNSSHYVLETEKTGTWTCTIEPNQEPAENWFVRGIDTTPEENENYHLNLNEIDGSAVLCVTNAFLEVVLK